MIKWWPTKPKERFVCTPDFVILFTLVFGWYLVTVKPRYQMIGKHTVLVPSSFGLVGIRICRNANLIAIISLCLVIHFPRITPAERPLFDANSAAIIFLFLLQQTSKHFQLLDLTIVYDLDPAV
jgi:hypothetical protein